MTMQRRRIWFAFVLLGLAVLVQHGPVAAVQATHTGVVAGRVIDDSSGAPIEAAIVTLHVSPSADLRTPGSGLLPSPFEVRQVTNGEGRFAFRRLPAGQIRVGAVRAGYVGHGPTASSADASRSAALAAGEHIVDLALRLQRFGTISGTVRDDIGEPGVGVNVFAYEWRGVGETRHLQMAGYAVTDDRGVYRISTLPPREYLLAVPMVRTTISSISASSPNGIAGNTLQFIASHPRQRVLPFEQGHAVTSFDDSGFGLTRQSDGTVLAALTTFYPGATVPSQAHPVVVSPGEERQGVDITVRLHVAGNIRGHVIGPDGPAPHFALQLHVSDPNESAGELGMFRTSTDADGSFLFATIPTGSYVIHAASAPGSALPAELRSVANLKDSGGLLWARQPISIGAGDLNGVTVTAHRGLRIGGRIHFDGAAERPDASRLTAIQILIQPADHASPPSPSVRIDGNGTFTTPGHPPGNYIVRLLNPPPGWHLRGVMHAGRDVADQPLELESRDVSGLTVVLTDRLAEVRGTVDVNPAVPHDVQVAIFPCDPRFWTNIGPAPRRLRLVPLLAAGRRVDYAFDNLPAGDYCLVAFAGRLRFSFPDARLLAELSRVATRITLHEGASLLQNLVLLAVPRLPDQAPRPDTGSDDGRPTDSHHRDDTPDGSSDFTPARIPHGNARRQQRDVAIDRTTAATRAIAGVVVDELTNQPVRRVRVIATPERGTPVWVDTDARGAFSLAVRPGRYAVEAQKPAYLSGFYGAPHAGRGPGMRVDVNDAPRSGIVIRIARGGVITGTVRDLRGAGQPAERVAIDRVRFVGGRRELTRAGNFTTDDRGVYRAYGLLPGRYVVSSEPSDRAPDLREFTEAEPGQPAGAQVAESADSGMSMAVVARRAAGRPVGYARTYHPGTTSLREAALVVINAGTEASSIDLMTRLVAMARVEGRLLREDGAPAARGTVMLTADGRSWAEVPSQNDGMFSTPYLPPGTYTVLARIPTVAEAWRPILWAQESVELAGEDVSGVTLVPREGATIVGRVNYEGQSPPPPIVRLSLSAATPAGANLTGVDTTTAIDSPFSIVTAPPGQYWIAAGPPIKPGERVTRPGFPPPPARPWGWMLKSAIWNGRDLLDAPLEVAMGQRLEDVRLTLTDKMAELSGRMLGPHDAVTDVFVMLMPADRAHWLRGARRFREPVSAAAGGFHFTGLPAGDYLLIALSDDDPGDLGDRALLDRLASGGIKVTVADGQHVVQDIRVR